jgi:3-oxoacyl-(acyl-carrier-protein) synthase
MNDAVYIAGLGAITAIGNNVPGCLASFEQGRAGIGPARYLQTNTDVPVAEVKLSNAELAELSGLPPYTSRTALLSLIAAREALAHAGLNDLSKFRCGFISANTVGGMDKSEQFYEQFMENPKGGRLKNVVDHECEAVTNIVAQQLGLRHYVSTISTACSSSANAIALGARLIKHGFIDIAVAGGVDALTRFTLNGFNSLMILDRELCQPFDQDRRGLNLGEGAGYVVLVSARVLSAIGAVALAMLSGYNNSNDAYHQTASSPDGTGSYLAMQGALAKSGLQTTAIDYINLHGTGTPNNDIAEGTAIQRLFTPHYPLMSSTKAFTGHTLGASGGIEAVFSVLSIMKGIIYPNLRFKTQMNELPFKPQTELLKGQDINHVLSNSFGFGGNCTSLIFSKA